MWGNGDKTPRDRCHRKSGAGKEPDPLKLDSIHVHSHSMLQYGT